MSRRWLLVFPVIVALALVTLPIYGEVLFGDDPPPEVAQPVLPPDPCPAGRPDGAVQHPNQYTDRAAPYAGPGVHRVRLVDAGGEINGVGRPYETEYLRLPVEWTAYDDNPGTGTQLVVCEYPVSAGSIAQTCNYSGQQVRFLHASYVYRVFEARTSRPVAEFGLDSDGVCPSEVRVDNGSRPAYQMLDSPNSDDLENALRPFVETGP